MCRAPRGTDIQAAILLVVRESNVRSRLPALVLLIAAVLCSSGCTSLTQWVKNGFKVGPNYEPPPPPVAEAWTHASDPRVQCDNPTLCAWWSVFHDPVLDELIDTAYHQNLDLKKAELRIDETRAGQNKACGDLFPQSQQNVAGYA